ncbi:MAG TPA: discoidin domain-containing protein, partial [Phycisphaerales bacterium]|nr:discoidin domain-containing protein [Phycisphaerales bacterium]
LYNFTQGSGFAIAQLTFPAPIELPENYELSFTLTGKGLPNDLEVKLLNAPADANGKPGESVWWVKRRNMAWPEAPTRVVNKAKHFQFAWGPLNGRKIRTLAGIEIVVASSSGGNGAVTVTDLEFRRLPPPAPYTGRPVATASSAAPEHPAAHAIDGRADTHWMDDDNVPPALTVDFGSERELDALRIDWMGEGGIAAYTVAASTDGRAWRTVWTGGALTGVRRSYADIPDTTARYLRIEPSKPGARAVGIAEVGFLTRPASSENLGVWPLIAADHAAHEMPRYFTGRQSSWTVLGEVERAEEALINEEGEVELWRGGPMLATALEAGGARVEFTSDPPRLAAGGLPAVTITRRNGALTLTTRAFAEGGAVVARYDVQNHGTSPVNGVLHLGLRPFQVNPPWQFLNNPGGVARVRSIVHRGDELLVDGAHSVALSGDGATRLHGFDDGEAMLVFSPRRSEVREVNDPHGAASAARSYPLALGPGESRSFVVRSAAAAPGSPAAALTVNEFEALEKRARQAWEARLNGASFQLPPGNEQLAASIRASLAYILINRDGHGFQPGSRSYERSWIRDGALTSAALLEFGLTDEVKRFIDWYAGYQFPSGAVPCVVDGRGADPVVENDSHGQLIYALAEYHRFTGDDAFALKHFGAVEKAVEHIEAERGKRKGAGFAGEAVRAEPGKRPVPVRAFFGLMPESISHEGYSAKPRHSYWDDFFTLKGLRDAAYLARVLKKQDAAERFSAAAADLAACLRGSVEAARAAHGVAYIPGCVELGDFDATSTTIAVNPCGALHDLPREWYDATFERWWSFFEARRDGRAEYVDYTPYEWRIVGTLVMLGQRERAWESVKWYLQDQLPPRKAGDTSANGWLHWAEIVHKDRGAGKWIGDMPHTWVASDFLRSVRTMFVYEEEKPAAAGQAGGTDLMLFAGVPKEWMDAPGGVSFSG